MKGPIVNRRVEITAETGSVASAPWPALGGSCSLAGQLQEPRYQANADVATHTAACCNQTFRARLRFLSSFFGVGGLLPPLL